jgi:hypothetical protein
MSCGEHARPLCARMSGNGSHSEGKHGEHFERVLLSVYARVRGKNQHPIDVLKKLKKQLQQIVIYMNDGFIDGTRCS